MDAAKVNQLKLFIEQCKANPSILTDPSISFFRDYLERYFDRILLHFYSKTPLLDLSLTPFLLQPRSQASSFR